MSYESVQNSTDIESEEERDAFVTLGSDTRTRAEALIQPMESPGSDAYVELERSLSNALTYVRRNKVRMVLGCLVLMMIIWFTVGVIVAYSTVVKGKRVKYCNFYAPCIFSVGAERSIQAPFCTKFKLVERWAPRLTKLWF